jgi:hypothetical protein
MNSLKFKIISSLWINLLVTAIAVFLISITVLIIERYNLPPNTEFSLIRLLAGPFLAVAYFGLFAGAFFSVLIFIFEWLFLLLSKDNPMEVSIAMLVFETLLVSFLLGNRADGGIALIFSYYLSQILRGYYIVKMINKTLNPR